MYSHLMSHSKDSKTSRNSTANVSGSPSMLSFNYLTNFNRVEHKASFMHSWTPYPTPTEYSIPTHQQSSKITATKTTTSLCPSNLEHLQGVKPFRSIRSQILSHFKAQKTLQVFKWSSTNTTSRNSGHKSSEYMQIRYTLYASFS